MNWLFVNTKSRLKLAVHRPIYALRALGRGLIHADERFLASATRSTTSQIRAFLEEPFNTPGFLDHLRQCGSTFSNTNSIGADLYAKKVLIQYAVSRALEPDTVVETGVANGVSSSYLLLALEKNGKGTLNSIDTDDRGFIPRGKQTGWIVPQGLRRRWVLHLGDSKRMLPELLRQLPPVDLFIHDSLHSYEHMMFEFQEAYPHLRRGGVLVADDASWNTAFEVFARSIGARTTGFIRGVGILEK